MIKKTSNKFLKFNLFHNENGSAIIFALLILVTVTIIGITSMNLSLTESSIVRNEKIHKQNFNIAESGYKKEAYYVGHSSKDWYKIINPEDFNHFLKPGTDPDFDPGADTGNTVAKFDETDFTTWPSGNLINNIADDKYDYIYLTTYLNPDKAPKGYDADSFSGYKFRM
ncbi:MAG: pilus assembly PilX N-terminal domain-containing protein, partial [Desulfobacteraceae bacterium]|nr:pilus assembly PilX N-terminal domain-containing protein [Desulfobacteraceae bacterium]